MSQLNSGYSLGSYVEADLSFLDLACMNLEKVLVILDLWKEPAENIVLVKGDKNYSEILEAGATDAIPTVML